MSSPVFDLAPDGLPDPPGTVAEQLTATVEATIARVDTAPSAEEAKGWTAVLSDLLDLADVLRIDLSTPPPANPPAEPQKPAAATKRTAPKKTTTTTTSKENKE